MKQWITGIGDWCRLVCKMCLVVFSPPAELQVNACYFCQSWQSTSNTPSIPRHPLIGYQDGLFLLRPNETPPSTAQALLLFCIDISGSMSITSQVKTAWPTAICSLFMTAGIHKAVEFHVINLCCFKVSEGEHIVHRSRLQVSLFQVSFELCKAENEHTLTVIYYHNSISCPKMLSRCCWDKNHCIQTSLSRKPCCSVFRD